MTARPALTAASERVRPAHYVLVAVVLSALLLDGLDVKLLAFTAPLMLAEWAIDKASFGPALAAALVGMAIGASIGGWCGDRFGRRSVIIGSTLLFGSATLCVSLVQDLTTLVLLRFIAGLGFGALTPNAYALVTEWLPARARTRAMSLLTIATPLGGSLGAAGIIWLLPLYGWRGCFMICGALTVLVGLVMTLRVPESIQFLTARGAKEQAARHWRRMMGDAPLPSFAATVDAEASARPARDSVLGREHRRLLVGSSLIFFFGQFVNYAFVSWLPVLLTAKSYALQDAVTAALMYNLFAIGGGIILVNAAGRFGSRILFLTASAVTLVALLLSGATLEFADHGDSTAKIALFCSLALIGGMSGGMIALICAVLTHSYPSACRATGVGMGVMMGRAGGIASALIGGMLLQEDAKLFFLALGCAMLIVMVGTLVMNQHIQAAARA